MTTALAPFASTYAENSYVVRTLTNPFLNLPDTVESDEAIEKGTAFKLYILKNQRSFRSCTKTQFLVLLLRKSPLLSLARRLARSIADTGWGKCLPFLEYKAAWYGRRLVKVGRFFPGSKQLTKS